MFLLYYAEYVEYIHISHVSIHVNDTKCDIGEMFNVVCGKEKLIYRLLV